MKLAALLFALQESAAGAAAPTSATPAAAPASPMGGVDLLVLGGAFIAIMYFVMIRPANRERKALAELIKKLKKNDTVVLSCGLIASVAAIQENEILVKVDDKNPLRMRFKKTAIQAVVERPTELAAEADEKGAKAPAAAG
jgi:preprotein translocase subunit YajC